MLAALLAVPFYLWYAFIYREAVHDRERELSDEFRIPTFSIPGVGIGQSEYRIQLEGTDERKKTFEAKAREFELVAEGSREPVGYTQTVVASLGGEAYWSYTAFPTITRRAPTETPRPKATETPRAIVGGGGGGGVVLPTYTPYPTYTDYPTATVEVVETATPEVIVIIQDCFSVSCYYFPLVFGGGP